SGQREKDWTSLKTPLPQPKLRPDMAFVIGSLSQDLEMRDKSNFIPENSEANEGYRCPTQDPDLEGQGADPIFIEGISRIPLLCVKAFADAKDTTGYTQRPVSENSFEGYRKLPGDKKEGIKDPRI
ncbi:hypothetical protein EI555_016053, partial [Monodon monoceros]